MGTVAIYLVVTFVAGLFALALRLPPLVGFLAAGFILNALEVERLTDLETLADLGVTLLLFGVGLKLDVRTLLRREVWLTTSVHMATSVVLGAAVVAALAAAGFGLPAGSDPRTFAILGFALSFSSTVLVVKILDDRGESQSLYGRIAVGVLIMQDVAAVIFLGIATDRTPSPWALALLGLIPLAWLLRKIWYRIVHDELQVLFGVVVALVPGYALFEAMGLKGDLGAVILGMLLASHPAAEELSQNLFSLKEVLLIGFFVSIGLTGMPTPESLVLSVALLLLLPLKAVGYAVILWLMRLRPRSSVMAGISLGNYSEFGLIVVAIGAESGLIDGQWLVVLSVSVALSFVISALVNSRGHSVSRRLVAQLPTVPVDRLNAIDRPIDIGTAEAVVLGLGRTGGGAYETLEREYGLDVVGVDADELVIAHRRSHGWNVREGDATDTDFWESVTSHPQVRLVVLAMPLHEVNLYALDQLMELGFPGVVGSLATFDEEALELTTHGAQAVFHLYEDAGASLAVAAVRAAGIGLPGA